MCIKYYTRFVLDREMASRSVNVVKIWLAICMVSEPVGLMSNEDSCALYWRDLGFNDVYGKHQLKTRQ